jgi:hypothetical protein
MLLSYLTLGLSLAYWAADALRECADYTGRRDVQPRTELALMLLFPPYAAYVLVCRLPALVRAARAQAGLTEPAPSPGLSFLSPFLWPAMPLLAMAYQDALNEAWLAER